MTKYHTLLEKWVVLQEIIQATILPIIILQLDILPASHRIRIFGLFFFVAVISILVNDMTLDDLGIRTRNLESAFRLFMPQAVILGLINLGVLLYFGLGDGLLSPKVDNNISLGEYIFISIPIQQFIYYGYLYPRLRKITQNRAIIAITIGLLFGAMHIPWDSVVLVIVATILGTLWAWLYSKQPNLWVVILSHEIIGFTAYLAFQ